METTFEGYLFDIYNVDSDIYLWLIDNERRLFLARDICTPFIYAHGPRWLTDKLAARLGDMQALALPPRLEKKLLFYKNEIIDAVRLDIAHPNLLSSIKRKLFTLYGKFDIYHSDIDPVSSYMRDKNIFPLGKLCIKTQIERSANRIVAIKSLEDAHAFDYDTPDLRILQMALTFSHRLGVTEHNPLILKIQTREYRLASRNEADYVHELNQILRAENPDCIISSYGDQVIFPFLFSVAQKYRLTLELDRDLTTQMTRSIKRKGSSFNTYGSWIFRAASYPLYGRWHIDQQNSFTFKHTDLAGTLELARISRMGVQRLARASTGNALTEMETEIAIKKNYLVPWQKSALENRKTWYDLHLYDKGGLVFQPDISAGVVRHNVAQLDFSQMYPSIMHLHNISPETINCPCCENNPHTPRVPEANYHICVKRRGVVSDALEHILARRKYYKDRLRTNLSASLRRTYEQRVDSLKWLNVVSFGYLGFRNAKFGKLESHESVTAFGRDKLLAAMRIAEEHGFELVHAITDCIFIERKGGLPIEPAELDSLREKIHRETLIELSLEGIYSWALFLPSRTDNKLPVANRYLGRFSDGKLKMRGIVARRKDAPEFIAEFQREILQMLASTENAAAVREVYPKAQESFFRVANTILKGEVPWLKLLIRRTVSHNLEDYEVKNGTSLTMQELEAQGLHVEPGEKVRFLAVALKRPDKSRRYMAEETCAASGKSILPYDTNYYVREVFLAFREIFQPFMPFDLSISLASLSGTGVTRGLFTDDNF